ncbi:receptor expression-enhancing protein 2 isoform X1 [Drosophila eugracilis]|uniref:receptor expression-enhancing protein 2 isoform X1 n=1 Tax=Drosophila eugracilis TaxID=29029 RepID=UPI0007E8459B|nr:receptor expression-enhancing protein 2 isoform X1 [Drosophila eugracilis]
MVYANVLRMLSLLVGCLYPAFASYKDLERSQNGHRHCDEDLRMWLSYWITYGVYMVFDYLTSSLDSIVPFLNEFKVLLLFWMLPTVGGGNEVIYEEFLRSFFNNNELSFDQVLTQATLTGGHLVGQLISSFVGYLMTVADSCLLSRGHRPALQITPSIEDLVNDAIAKRQLQEKRKQMPNLSDTINEVLGDKTNKDSFEFLSESESDLLVLKDHISRPKEKPETPPKPMRPTSQPDEEMNLNLEMA